MNARYGNKTINLTPRYIAAIKELIRAELEMMGAVDPEQADCWTWGRAEITDLESTTAFTLTFGGDESLPEGMKGDAMVVSRLNH